MRKAQVNGTNFKIGPCCSESKKIYRIFRMDRMRNFSVLFFILPILVPVILFSSAEEKVMEAWIGPEIAFSQDFQ